jgi:hypothetical protein
MATELIKLTSTTTQPVSEDVKLALETILKKKPVYDLLYNYYRGNHPLRYSTERLKKAFSKIGVYFAQNWIAVVVDAVLDRLVLKGFDVTDNDEADKKLDEMWEQYEMGLLADDVHEAATVVSEAYVIAWKEDAEEGEDEILDVYFNDPRMCHMFYDTYRPTKKRFAAKLWINKDRYPCMILYYTDKLEHYKAISPVSKLGEWITTASNMQPDPKYGDGGIESHDHGIVPVFHFRAGRTSGKKEIGQSEISLQDAVNKLFADMMVGSEFSTFNQRAIIAQADPGNLKNEAGVNWFIPGGDGKGQAASVIELGNKSLENYIQAIDHVSQSMAIISRTPKHYLMLNGGDPSGDALLAMEAPLVKKVKKRIAGYDPEWKALAAFMLQLEGIVIEKKAITSVWEPVTSNQPLASAQTIKTEVESGVPLITSVRRAGWAKDEMLQMEKDVKEEDKKQSKLAQQELERLRAESDASNNTNSDGSNSDNLNDGK